LTWLRKSRHGETCFRVRVRQKPLLHAIKLGDAILTRPGNMWVYDAIVNPKLVPKEILRYRSSLPMRGLVSQSFRSPVFPAL
jgi:hypothetical protein